MNRMRLVLLYVFGSVEEQIEVRPNYHQKSKSLLQNTTLTIDVEGCYDGHAGDKEIKEVSC